MDASLHGRVDRAVKVLDLRSNGLQTSWVRIPHPAPIFFQHNNKFVIQIAMYILIQYLNLDVGVQYNVHIIKLIIAETAQFYT